MDEETHIKELSLPEGVLSKRIEDALDFAKEVHAKQKRKDGSPYVNHPIRVCEKVAMWDKDESLLIAALLHDVLEDTDASEKEIQVRYGLDVLSYVLEVTNDPEEIRILGKTDYLKTKMSVTMSDKALLLKLCDRWDNISDLYTLRESDESGGPEAREKIKMFVSKYRVETMDILQEVKTKRQGLGENHLSIMKRIKDTLSDLEDETEA
eukprot:TRINITY_DN4914_c0_g1_i1.p1 TRINITY_DN4914_c0_g1~~TRINITY_DN4914_c0_g1_i1.p1  ORF type:complete len:232 (+),score=71.39 TRINITY_DN4914_c0_g1_i1:72-698(+)